MKVVPRIPLWIGLGIACIMMLCPPWQLPTIHGFDYWGYSFLLTPPDVDPDSRRIDWARLLIQWSMTAAVITGWVISLRWKAVIGWPALGVLWVGVAAVVLMGLFPPYAGGDSGPDEYGLLFSPPGARGYVDWTRLLVQWSITAA